MQEANCALSLPDEIVEDIRSAVADGCREIWLTSQDDSQYGMDTGVKLPELLRMISEIPGDFKVRVGMMNPFSVLPILDDLVEAFDSDKIFKLLHLPIQSASHSVLKNMNRLHKMECSRHDHYKIPCPFRRPLPLHRHNCWLLR